METEKKNKGLLFPERPPRRHSYMLRCLETQRLRSTQNGSGTAWMFSLHDPKSDAVMNFQNLDALVSYLQRTFDEG
jgi:hypothetical protein